MVAPDREVMLAAAVDRFGPPNIRLSTASQLRFGKRGSKVVDLNRALWFDHEVGQGGSLLWRGSPNARAIDRPEQSSNGASNRQKAALDIWEECLDPTGTPAEQYLARRGLRPDPNVAGRAIRFHPYLYYDGSYLPGMVALYRDIVTDEPCGIHRTFFDRQGRKLDRRMLGRVRNAAIKLDSDEDVVTGLVIGEGIETCLSARQLGWSPCWALGSAGAIANFPVLGTLGSVDALTIAAEPDEASSRAIDQCLAGWQAAGREVNVIRSLRPGDLNDLLQGG